MLLELLCMFPNGMILTILYLRMVNDRTLKLNANRKKISLLVDMSQNNKKNVTWCVSTISVNDETEPLMRQKLPPKGH